MRLIHQNSVICLSSKIGLFSFSISIFLIIEGIILFSLYFLFLTFCIRIIFMVFLVFKNRKQNKNKNSNKKIKSKNKNWHSRNFVYSVPARHSLPNANGMFALRSGETSKRLSSKTKRQTNCDNWTFSLSYNQSINHTYLSNQLPIIFNYSSCRTCLWWQLKTTFLLRVRGVYVCKIHSLSISLLISFCLHYLKNGYG